MNTLLIYVLKFYKGFISPPVEKLFGKACRFTPSCSEYTIIALERFGIKKGVFLGIKRFARCHPLGGSGWDPVPVLK
jgi:uncharacterized protein